MEHGRTNRVVCVSSRSYNLCSVEKLFVDRSCALSIFGDIFKGVVDVATGIRKEKSALKKAYAKIEELEAVVEKQNGILLKCKEALEQRDDMIELANASNEEKDKKYEHLQRNHQKLIESANDRAIKDSLKHLNEEADWFYDTDEG